MADKIRTEDQSGGVNIGGDARAGGDIVGKNKNVFITLIGTGAAIIVILGLVISQLLPYFLPASFFSSPPAPTPLAFAPASSSETLLIIATFDDRSAGQFSGIDPAQRIYNLITEKLPGNNLKLRVERFVQPIQDTNKAREVLKAYGATLLIWGWYDKLGAEPQVELDKDKITLKNPRSPEFSLATPESFVVRFTKEIPAQSAYVAFFSLGMMQLNTGASNIASTFFTQAIDSASLVDSQAVNPWEALMWRGNVYAWSGEHNLAIGDYTKALALYPHREGYFNRGVEYSAQSTQAAAIADYSKAIEIDPKYAMAYYNRGNAYTAQGNYAAAFADYSKAIEVDPKYKEAYLNRGNAYTAQGNYAAAIADYSKAIEIDPKYAMAYYNRGRTYFDQGNYTAAIADYSKAIEIDPKFKEAYFNRGVSYGAQGNSAAAIADYSKAIEIDPNYQRAYTGRGNAYADWKKFDLAILDYQKALKADPGDAYTYCVLGITYTKMGDFKLAVVNLEQGVQRDTKSEYPWCKKALEDARMGTPTP